MRVLFIAPRIPWPADTGAKIRTLNILKQVAQKYPVDLVCYSFEHEDDLYVKHLEAFKVRVHLVRIEDAGFLDKAALILFDSKPFSVMKYLTEDMEKAINKLLAQNSYQLVHVDHIHMAHYQHLFGNIPCMVDEHNVEYRILERCAEIEQGWKKWVYENQAKKMRRFEAAALDKFNHLFAVSEGDKTLLQELTGGRKPVNVVANGVDTQFFQPQSMDPPKEAIIFTGSMDWLPNEDAAAYFYEEILPLIWKVRGNLNFMIVGKNPTKNILHIAQLESRVTVTGRVDDVRPFMDQAKVFVCPLRIGGGTRLKILEAMSMKKAVVSTMVGAEGLGCTDGKNIAIADTPQQFAAKVIQLLEFKDARLQMGEAARAFVVENFEWNSIGEKLRDIYGRYIR